jgi:glycosyltransferase involved in cell wall biosynthesis
LSPDGYLSLGSDVKQIPVIHDLSFVHYPEDLPFLNEKYVNHYFPKFAKKASKIITVSEYSKSDIEKSFGISEDKITVAHNGIGDFFQPILEEKKKETRSKFTNGKEYFLFVSALQPRKNVTKLFEAFDQFKKETKSDVKLLMVGEKYWWNKEIKQVFDAMTYQSEVIFTGHIQAEDLKNVYGAGLALTYVSYFEGFGIPLVEAMKCELPIISSDKTSLPEVGGEAAIYVNPFSTEDIKNGMLRIFKDQSLREELIENGKSRAQLFSWDKTAKIVWDTIVEVHEEN